MTKESFLSTTSLITSAFIKPWANTDEVIQRLNYWICECTFYRQTRSTAPTFRIICISMEEYLQCCTQNEKIVRIFWPLKSKSQFTWLSSYLHLFFIHNDSSSCLIFIITHQVKMQQIDQWGRGVGQGTEAQGMKFPDTFSCHWKERCTSLLTHHSFWS